MRHGSALFILFFFFFNDTATTEIYTLSLHDALPIFDLLADDVRLDRQLTPAAIHQHAERDALGAAEVGELVERGAHGTAGIQHVVHDHDVLTGELPRDAGLADDGLGTHRFEVVAVEGDVERAAWHA